MIDFELECIEVFGKEGFIAQRLFACVSIYCMVSPRWQLKGSRVVTGGKNVSKKQKHQLIGKQVNQAMEKRSDWKIVVNPFATQSSTRLCFLGSFIIMCHFEAGALITAFDVEAFICFGAVENRLFWR